MNLKSSRELDIMRRAGSIVAGALKAAGEAVKPGASTEDVNRAVEEYIVGQGARPSFKNYRGFPAAACVSINREVVHGIPSKERLLQEGDIVGVDVGAEFEGYHGDAARTFAVGAVDAEAQRLIDVTKQCFFKGIAMAKEGNRLGDISAAIQQHAESNGFGVVRELVGHGIGQHLHEAPDVPNFGRAGHGVRLCAGMTLAIEPMINAGVADVEWLEDKWTVVTKDGKNSAHYENTIVITQGEPEILTMHGTEVRP